VVKISKDNINDYGWLDGECMKISLERKIKQLNKVSGSEICDIFKDKDDPSTLPFYVHADIEDQDDNFIPKNVRYKLLNHMSDCYTCAEFYREKTQTVWSLDRRSYLNKIQKTGNVPVATDEQILEMEIMTYHKRLNHNHKKDQD